MIIASRHVFEPCEIRLEYGQTAAIVPRGRNEEIRLLLCDKTRREATALDEERTAGPGRMSTMIAVTCLEAQCRSC